MGSSGSEKSQSRVYNKFEVLDDDDDLETAGLSSSNPNAPKSRLEGLRQGMASRVASASAKAASSGRSLADLAASAPEKPTPVNRFATLPTNEIRFTRERLLSMRPQPHATEVPEVMQHVAGTIVLTEEAQDPVCFDSFEAEAIWASVRRATAKVAATRETSTGSAVGSASTGMPIMDVAPPPNAVTGTRARSGSSSGRWQRGVALPPPSARREAAKDADNPEDLWDDPMSSPAMDFSAFGDTGEDEEDDGGDAFDFEKMAEESRLLDGELHPGSAGAKSSSTAGPPKKMPLAVKGTTIYSGSGDDVNVFEDFDEPAAELTSTTTTESAESAGVKGASEDPTASSRLMAMIGVQPNQESGNLAALVGRAPPGAAPAQADMAGWGNAEPKSAVNGLSIPLNPWGGSSLLGVPPSQPAMSQPAPRQQQQQQPQDMNLQVRLREAEMEKQREMSRRQQEQVEAQKQAANQQDAQRQAGVQSQVEVILMERISVLLENSWGRSDLNSVLTTLHSEDSRVIPLLSSVDALRALLLRNNNRVRLQHDPAFGAEMAVLLVTNTQWQQQQQVRAQQEEIRLRMQQEQKQQQEQQRQREELTRTIRPDAPWFYSDPHGNIQGPFRPEEMRQWLEAGYFKGDLPVSQNPKGPFKPLSNIFLDLNAAFVFNEQPQQPDPRQQQQAAEEEARRMAAQQEQAARAAAEAAELERRKRGMQEEEQRMRLAAEAETAERRAQEEAAAAKTTNGNESSAQLKLMLGLAPAGAPSKTPAPEAKPEAPKRKSAKAQPAPAAPRADAAPSPTNAASASPAWGKASQSLQRKSMSEIQKEEARAAALATMNRETSRSSGSGWANVAAAKGGTSGWVSGTVRTAPAAVLSRPGASATAPSPHAPRGKNPTDVAAMNAQTASSQQSNAQNSPADEFGANMSPLLEKWCKDQMMKLNGTEDMTLCYFCMTLTDPNEIRQYLTAYLGSTPAVNNFATEFNRKRGITPPTVQEEWANMTPVTKKKGKKKAGR